MPCNCDYMNPNSSEKNISRVACLLDELNGKKEIDKKHWEGYHPKVYCEPTKDLADKMTSELCSKLQKVKDITKYSLEMQIWWRDHQKADKKRVEKELAEQKEEADRQQLLNKLSPYEKKLLGIN